MAYHNVTVRLDENDYKQLLFIQEKYNRLSYGKVSLADVLRISVTETFLLETTNINKPVTNIEESRRKALEIITGKTTEQINKEASKSRLSEEEIVKILNEYETELRQGTTKKNKPFTEAYIQQQLKTKRKELEG